VQAFIPLEGVGHCPQDEAPEWVNSLLSNWVSDVNVVKEETNQN
jgi:hypothetical protein